MVDITEVFDVASGQASFFSDISGQDLQARFASMRLLSVHGEMCSVGAAHGFYFAFPSGSLNLESPKLRDFRLFRDFPLGKWDFKRFNAEDYEDFKAAYRKIPAIEKSGFELLEVVKATYARLKVTEETALSLIQITEKRLQAGFALLQSAFLYYKRCKTRLKALIIRQNSINTSEIQSEKYGNLIESLKLNVNLKLSNVKKQFQSVKSQISKSKNVNSQISALFQKNLTSCKSKDFFSKIEVLKGRLIEVRNAYNEFRETLSEVLSTAKVVNRGQKSVSLLSFEETFLKLSEEFENFSNAENEGNLLLEKLKGECDKANRGLIQAKDTAGYVTKLLEVKFLLKIAKFESLLSGLERKLSSLSVQNEGNFETQYEEIQTVNNRLSKHSADLAEKISIEQRIRKEFIQKYGSLIPEHLFPHFCSVQIREQSEHAELHLPEKCLQQLEVKKSLAAQAFQSQKSKIQSELQSQEQAKLDLSHRLHQQQVLNKALKQELAKANVSDPSLSLTQHQYLQTLSEKLEGCQ